MAADSTMLRMVKRLMALSLGVHREQLLQRIGLTWPLPFLLRPLFFLFFTIVPFLLLLFFLFFGRKRGGEEVVVAGVGWENREGEEGREARK